MSEQKSYNMDQPPPYSGPGQHQSQSGQLPPPPGLNVTYHETRPIHVQSPPTVVVTSPTVVAVGLCPACRNGVLTNEFTCLGIFLAICFFPIGVLCCVLLMHKRCTHCGAIYG